MMKKPQHRLIGLGLCFFASLLFAKGTYQDPVDFVNEAFAGEPPKRSTFWITKKLRPQVDKIMQHRYPVLKVRYWLKGKRSVWILEEIGKVKPITAGFVIDDPNMTAMHVLIYRETHGWEIRRKGFRDQFEGVTLTKKHRLSQQIDGITGATLSVNAVKNMAKLALFLHQQVIKADDDG